MKKLSFLLLLFYTVMQVSAQKKQFVNAILSGHVSEMVYDEFLGFTGTGLGGSLQLQLNTKHKLKPQIDVSASLFPINKIAFILPDGSITGAKGAMLTIFAGFIYEPVNRLETGLSGGLALHVDGSDFGLKPYAAYYLGKKKIIKAHAALTHIFIRNQFSNYNTGIINTGLAIKLF